MPIVSCHSCGLTSYAATPHSAASPCPYCDAELFPGLRPTRPRPAAAPALAPTEDDAAPAGGDLGAEAA